MLSKGADERPENLDMERGLHVQDNINKDEEEKCNFETFHMAEKEKQNDEKQKEEEGHNINNNINININNNINNITRENGIKEGDEKNVFENKNGKNHEENRLLTLDNIIANMRLLAAVENEEDKEILNAIDGSNIINANSSNANSNTLNTNVSNSTKY